MTCAASDVDKHCAASRIRFNTLPLYVMRSCSVKLSLDQAKRGAAVLRANDVLVTFICAEQLQAQRAIHVNPGGYVHEVSCRCMAIGHARTCPPWARANGEHLACC